VSEWHSRKWLRQVLAITTVTATKKREFSVEVQLFENTGHLTHNPLQLSKCRDKKHCKTRLLMLCTNQLNGATCKHSVLPRIKQNNMKRKKAKRKQLEQNITIFLKTQYINTTQFTSGDKYTYYQHTEWSNTITIVIINTRVFRQQITTYCCYFIINF